MNKELKGILIATVILLTVFAITEVVYRIKMENFNHRMTACLLDKQIMINDVNEREKEIHAERIISNIRLKALLNR